MTSSIDATNPLTRITLGAFEDMGFTVDYTKAEAFSASQLGSCPPCNSQRKRRRRLGGREGDEALVSETTRRAQERRLSDSGYEEAYTDGMVELQRINKAMIAAGNEPVQEMTVMYLEDGAIHDVQVEWSSIV